MTRSAFVTVRRAPLERARDEARRARTKLTFDGPDVPQIIEQIDHVVVALDRMLEE